MWMYSGIWINNVNLGLMLTPVDKLIRVLPPNEDNLLVNRYPPIKQPMGVEKTLWFDGKTPLPSGKLTVFY